MIELIIALVLITLVVLFLLSTMCRRNHKDLPALRGWVYAHRGLHGAGIPENSLKAFQKARDAGYGAELDVHLMADGELAVIHDASLKRTTGAEGFIEDLTAPQLREYYLENTLQTIPLLQDVLNVFSGKAPLIIELKCERNNYAQLCQAVCKMLDDYDGVYCLESFDPRCIFWLRKNRPDLIRGQLAENYFKSANCKLPFALKWLLSWQMLNFLVYPDFIAYRHSNLRHFSNFLCRKLWKVQGVTWTIRNQDSLDKVIRKGWIPIFEGFKP